MNGFEYDKDDPYSTVSTKTPRSRLRSNLPDLQLIMQQKIEAFLKREISRAKITDGTRTLRHVTLKCPKRLETSMLEVPENIFHGDTIDREYQQRRGCWRTSRYVL